MSGLVVEGASLRVAGPRLFANLTFAVAPGAALSVMGPSGSGKSALLAFVGGHLDPAFHASGRVSLDDRDLTGVAPERRAIGLMFQDDLLFPHLSVGANIAFGLREGGRARHAAVENAALSLARPHVPELKRDVAVREIGGGPVLKHRASRPFENAAFTQGGGRSGLADQPAQPADDQSREPKALCASRLFGAGERGEAIVHGVLNGQ